MSVGFLDIRAIWGITPVAVRSYDLSFLYSGRDWYSARHADEEYRRFTAATGIRRTWAPASTPTTTAASGAGPRRRWRSSSPTSPLCWPALLLIQIAETITGQTWPELCEELQWLHAVTYTGPAGTFRQTIEPSKRPTATSSLRSTSSRPK